MKGNFEKKTGGRAVTAVLAVLMLGFAAMAVFGGWKLLQDRQERQVGNDTYASLAESMVTVQSPEVLPEAPEEESPAVQETVKEPAVVKVDFDALHALNPQVVAWIRSNDGGIDYPVVRGTDNEYYLNHLVDGTVNRNGSIFMDFRNGEDFSDDNTILYGHNMLDGTMFASLGKYSTPGYYDANRELQMLTPEGDFRLEVFAGCVAPGNSDLYQLTFTGEQDKAAYLEKILVLSEFSTEVQVGVSDRLVTLSTCAYDYEDARYLLFCRMVPAAELAQ